MRFGAFLRVLPLCVLAVLRALPLCGSCHGVRGVCGSLHRGRAEPGRAWGPPPNGNGPRGPQEVPSEGVLGRLGCLVDDRVCLVSGALSFAASAALSTASSVAELPPKASCALFTTSLSPMNVLRSSGRVLDQGPAGRGVGQGAVTSVG